MIQRLTKEQVIDAAAKARVYIPSAMKMLILVDKVVDKEGLAKKTVHQSNGKSLDIVLPKEATNDGSVDEYHGYVLDFGPGVRGFKKFEYVHYNRFATYTIDASQIGYELRLINYTDVGLIELLGVFNNPVDLDRERSIIINEINDMWTPKV